ncbi:MAG: ribonuclease P protein component [Comamonadaceae bacterium]|nr:ribonuclease P protein component [Comamonadaceae bacterium]
MLRLKTRSQFQAVLAGDTLSKTPHFALHRLALTGIVPLASSDKPLWTTDAVWIGAMVPKRWAKRAVTRNTIKRQVYAVSLTFEPMLACAAHVVRLRRGFDRQQFVSATSDDLKTAVCQELMQLFSKAVGGLVDVSPRSAC